MADVLSVTGSVLQILGLALQSCELLCKFLRSFKEAAEDLEHHIATLQALKSTFARISDLEREFTNLAWVSKPLSSRLQECVTDLKAMEDFVKPLHSELFNGKTRRAWMKTKWAGANQKERIEKFMARFESYHMTFSLDLLLINTRLALKSSDESLVCKNIIVCPSDLAREDAQTSSTRASQIIIQLARRSCTSFPSDYKRNIANTDSHRLPCTTSEEVANASADRTSVNVTSNATENAVGPPVNFDASTTQIDGHRMHFDSSDATPALSFRLESTSFRNICIKASENSILPFSWWLGQINVDQVMERLRESPRTLRIDRGYSVGFAVALPWGFALRYEVLLYFWRKGVEPSLSFSLDSHLSFPRIVSWDTKSVRSTMCGDVDAMKIEFGLKEATPFDVMPDGSTLLHLAAMQNQFAMVKLLVEQGARVNATNNFGESPLHRAVQFAKDYRITSLLLIHGGDLCILTNDQKTPLHTFFNDVVERTLLACASRPLLPEFFEPDDRGRTLLQYLCWSSKCLPDTFKLVHTRSPSCISNLDTEGRSILHYAAQRGNFALLAYILSTTSALDVNDRDCRGMAPMHYAVESRRAVETIKLLARHGADSFVQDDKGGSPLHLAGERDNQPAMQALLELCPTATSELQVAGRYSITPLHVAEQSGSNIVRAFPRDVIGARDDCQRRPCEHALPNRRHHAYNMWDWTNVIEDGKRISGRVKGLVLSYFSLLAADINFILRSGRVIVFLLVIGFFIRMLWRS